VTAALLACTYLGHLEGCGTNRTDSIYYLLPKVDKENTALAAVAYIFTINLQLQMQLELGKWFPDNGFTPTMHVGCIPNKKNWPIHQRCCRQIIKTLRGIHCQGRAYYSLKLDTYTSVFDRGLNKTWTNQDLPVIFFQRFHPDSGQWFNSRSDSFNKHRFIVLLKWNK